LKLLDEGDCRGTMTSTFLLRTKEEYKRREMGTYYVLLDREMKTIKEYLEDLKKEEKKRSYVEYLKEQMNISVEDRAFDSQANKRNYLAHAGLSLECIESIEPTEKGYVVKYRDRTLPKICD
jgi:hypothetical protein